jgi:hypothetical protein
MIVHKVNIGRLAILEPKNNPPVRAHGHSPKALKVALQWMKAECRQLQRLDRLCRMQYTQNLPDLAEMLGVDTSGAVILEKLP